jgi:hypothetical protein
VEDLAGRNIFKETSIPQRIGPKLEEFLTARPRRQSLEDRSLIQHSIVDLQERKDRLQEMLSSRPARFNILI